MAKATNTAAMNFIFLVFKGLVFDDLLKDFQGRTDQVEVQTVNEARDTN